MYAQSRIRSLIGVDICCGACAGAHVGRRGARHPGRIAAFEGWRYGRQ